MVDKWSFSGAKIIGRGHEKTSLPCQDSIMSTERNGVYVIALSDGCGSSPLSEVGSQLSVELLCELFTQNFDELYLLDEKEIKQRIITLVRNKTKEYIEIDKNRKAIEDIINKNLPIYETLNRRYKQALSQGKENEIKYYLTTALNATLQAVAIKDDKMIAIRLGDGLIGEIKNGELKITSSEDKLDDIESNVTYYPSYVGFLNNKDDVCWDLFEVIKSENASEYDLIFIVCDGVADLIRFPDGEEQYIEPSEMDEIIKYSSDPLPLLEKYKEREKDDLSIIMLKSREPSYENVVLREYDENGRTINNTKLVPKEDLYPEKEETETIKEESLKKEASSSVKAENEDDEEESYINVILNQESFTKNLFSKEQTKRIEEYLDNEEYRSYFLEQASIIKEHLENGGDGSFPTIRVILGEYVEDDDFELLIKQFSLLKLFQIDKGQKIITKGELNEA